VAGKHRDERTPAEPEATPPTSMVQIERERPYPNALRRKPYEHELRLLQIELLKLESWVKATGARIVILFEGRDAAGKGGAIRRFTENLNPRGARVVALGKPSEVERSQWYFQRYIAHLPAAGEVVLFDRSWYNRAGVEIVMGFCTPREHAEFLRQAPPFEESLVQSGIRLFKLWFTVSETEQRRRFADREHDPLRRWKFSAVDHASLGKFDEYGKTRNEMFFYTDRPVSPWTVVNSNEKRRARLEAIRYVLDSIPYDHKDTGVARAPNPCVVRPAQVLSFPPEPDGPRADGSAG
jgi:polyphosphate kinase